MELTRDKFWLFDVSTIIDVPSVKVTSIDRSVSLWWGDGILSLKIRPARPSPLVVIVG
jgi:hypothetical protein